MPGSFCSSLSAASSPLQSHFVANTLQVPEHKQLKATLSFLEPLCWALPLGSGHHPCDKQSAVNLAGGVSPHGGLAQAGDRHMKPVPEPSSSAMPQAEPASVGAREAEEESLCQLAATWL